MSLSTAATMILLSLLAHPGNAVSRSAHTRAALNFAGEDRRAAAAALPAASLAELGADASISSRLSHGISAHERAAMQRLAARNASHTASAAPAATVTEEQLAAATTDQLEAELAARVTSNDAPEVAAVLPEVATAEAIAPTAEATKVAAAEDEPVTEDLLLDIDNAVNATSMAATSTKDEPATEDLLADIDKDLLAALTNASAVLDNAAQVADLMNESTLPESEPSDDAAEHASGENVSWSAWPGPLEPAGSDPSNATEIDDHAEDIGVPPSPLDSVPDLAGQVESNATHVPLDGELGRLISDLHNRIDNGVVPAAVNAETKSAEYTHSLEELRDSIVGFKQGVVHFEDRAKAKHRAVMRRVQQALDTQRFSLNSTSNSTSAAANPAPTSTPAQSEPSAASPASQEPSPSSPAPDLESSPPLA